MKMNYESRFCDVRTESPIVTNNIMNLEGEHL